MHPLLERQIARATRPSGDLDVAVLLQLVDAAYAESDRERERNDRAALLTCEEMDKLNEELRKLAHHDMLTGLPNRLAFADFVRRAAGRAKQGERFAILLVDLDRFKAVNDMLGHAMGDALLCEVAARLRRAVREGDRVARMGGDEFAILVDGSGLPESAEQLAHRLVRSVGAPYVIRGCAMAVGASVGVAVGDPGDHDPDLLLRNADIALYQAKNEGRSTWRVYAEDADGCASDGWSDSASEASPDQNQTALLPPA
ncbi:MAG: GGDEF domain-containing protein [Candidatus Velthaea sp.]|jgi:diguanylate cyclase (GGDEF)-like protein